MKDDRKKFEEFAELAQRGREHLLHRLGQRSKPEGQVGTSVRFLSRSPGSPSSSTWRRRAARPPGACFDTGCSNVWMMRLLEEG